ncbi:MAG: hypothetical protein FJ271_12720 [Planctomycetes bacterium]|nr:hypothetical protein [Planctomycetota bacterium]
MLPHSLAFAWLLWRQHRYGLILVLGYLLFAGTTSAIISTHGSPEFIENVVGGLIVIGLATIPVFLLGAFAYGFDGDTLARESCFPQRLFRLPVPTGALVFWPMLYGALAASLLWLVVWLILRPRVEVPLAWPAILMAASLAWVQALVWTPCGLPWLRVILFAIVIQILIALGVFSAVSGVAEPWLVGLHASLALVAWAIAYVGVAHARCGHVPDWRAILAPLRKLARWLPQSRKSFTSAGRAHLWFEWRLAGKSLAFSTGLVLVVVLMPLLLPENDHIPTAHTLLSALALPVFLAGLSGCWPGTGKNRWIKDRVVMMPFIATLPMHSADMIGAMLKSAVWSTLSAWMIVMVMVPSAVVLTGRFQDVADGWHHIAREHPPGAIAAGIVAIALWLFVWTWKRKVDGLYIGLTGRVWVSLAILCVYLLGALPLLIAVIRIVNHPEIHEVVLRVLPWLLGALLLGRLLLVAWALRQVFRQGLLRPKTVARWLAAWLLLASTLFVVLAWVVPRERVPIYYLAYAVVFVMPMARLAATPLALAWNRHR